MTVSHGPIGLLAKITAIAADGHHAYFDLRDGKTGSFSDPNSVYSVGDVILIAGDNDTHPISITRAPTSAWPDNAWVGIVRYIFQTSP